MIETGLVVGGLVRRKARLAATFVGFLGLGGAVAVGQVPEKYQGDCTDAGCHGGLVRKRHVHPPVSDACDVCHESEDETAHEFTLTEEGATLCFDCHDEFAGKNVHSPVADGDCTTCHDPHASDTRGLLAAESVGVQCADCHDDVTEDLAFLHGPAAAGECTACHSPHASERSSLLLADGTALCFECHDDIEDRIADSKHVHAPVGDDCTACHDPHGAGNRFMLSSKPPTLCGDCHDDITEQAEDATHPHSPVTEGAACTNCHDAHASEFSGVLVKAQFDVCLTCHAEEIKTETRTLANIGAKLEAMPNHHGPIRDRECTPCHTPHGGERKALLAEDYPPRLYAAYSEDRYTLCFDCHDVEAFENAEAEDETAFRNGTQNLHYLHVNRPTKGRSCRACHDPHASDNAKHIVGRVTFGRWEIPIKFALTETGGTCLPGCHKRYRYDREQPVVNLEPATATVSD